MTDQKLERARYRVRQIRGFYVHLSVYVVVMTGLAVINWLASPAYWWVAWPLVGWGIALAVHGVSVVLESTVFGPDWEERKTQELLDKADRPA